MKHRILEVLECPFCHKHLEPVILEQSLFQEPMEIGETPLCKEACTFGKVEPESIHNCRKCISFEIKTGLLMCQNDPPHIFPIVNHIPRMLPDALASHMPKIREHIGKLPQQIRDRLSGYLNDPGANLEKEFIHIRESFSSEWEEIGEEDRAWGQDIQARRKLFFECFQLQSSNNIKGKKILDAGCGHGEVELSILDCGAEIFAVDLSRSVDIVQARLRKASGRFPVNVHLIQGNIHHLPLRADFFDIVHSAGVLHHTPDTFQGFKEITRTLAGGGVSFIEVYSADHKNTMEKIRYHATNLLRSFTKRMPHPLLHAMCYLLAPPHWIYVNCFNLISGEERYLRRSIRETELSLFDGFSPLFDWHHSTEQVNGWFRQLKYTDIAKTFHNHSGIGLVGTLNRESKN